MAKVRKQGNIEIRSKRVLLPITLQDLIIFMFNETTNFPVMEQTYKMVCKLLKKSYAHNPELYSAVKEEFNLRENQPKIDNPVTEFNTPDINKMIEMQKHNLNITSMLLLGGQVNTNFRLFRKAGFVLELEILTNKKGNICFRDEIFIYQVDRSGELVKYFDTPITIPGLCDFDFLDYELVLSTGNIRNLKFNNKMSVDMNTITDEMKESTLMDNGVSILATKEFWGGVLRLIQASTISFKTEKGDMDRIARRSKTSDRVVEDFEKCCPKSAIGKDSIKDRSKLYNSVDMNTDLNTAAGLEETYFAIKNNTFDDKVMSKENDKALMLVYSTTMGGNGGGFILTSLDKVNDTFGEELKEIDLLRIKTATLGVLNMGATYTSELYTCNNHHDAVRQYDQISMLKGARGSLLSPFGGIDFSNKSNDDEGPLMN